MHDAFLCHSIFRLHPVYHRPTLSHDLRVTILSTAIDGITYDSVEVAFVGYVYGASTAGQAALYQLVLTGIPITNVNNGDK
ncbi:hypothetical protein EDB92DRAFT_1961099 [Lactarius akahatsu]|uniref:Uncharacterized protein n=1 Tax=Lactarius akahatsu TaxID=416441 RepID=A0AAD4L3X6_9AGAM|nr:hypothetical protein EDB92DRAFT_1961099 [Lactarius akahatsu]